MGRTWLLSAAVSWALAPAPLARAAADVSPADKIDEVIKSAGVTEETPGVAVLVIEGGRVTFRKGYGLANLKEKTPIRPETTFELASLSKPFTATAVLILYDKGKLSLDDDVRKYIPELPEFDKKSPIRLTHLLHHTSGLPDYTRFPLPTGRDPKYVGNEDYAKLIADKPKLVKPRFSPGERFEYSNTNYLLLALIAERVSGKSFGKFLRDEVFDPLGMKNSWVYDHPDATPKHPTLGYVNALGYRKALGSWWEGWGSPPYRTEKLLTSGDGSIWTSLEDMALWDAALRRGKVVKPATWRQALTPSKTRDGKTNPYGLGWVLELGPKGEVTSFGHEGSWGGFRTAYYRCPDADRAIILLSNRGDFDTSKVRRGIDALFSTGKPGKK